jgi:hypothetical protein
MSRAGAAPHLVHPTAHLGGGNLARLARAGVFLVAMLVAAAVLLHFHDRFWWAPAEGAHAHVAERLLAGEALHGTVRDLRTDFVHFANALAFGLFGVDLASLRYPPAALTFIQSAVIFWLLAGRGILPAFAGAVAMSCLTFVQFLIPASHWHALFLCILMIALLSKSPGERRGTCELLGFLLVGLFLFRPLSGVFAALGVFTFLLLQEQRPAERERAVLARGLALVLFAGLALYLRAAVDFATAALFGAGPLVLLGYGFATTGLGDRGLCRLALRMALGGLLALGPLLAYHLSQGTLAPWWDDSVLAPLAVSRSGLAGEPRYAELALQGLAQVTSGGAAALLNGLFWFLLPLLPACLGLAVVSASVRQRPAGRAALPVVACFFALVSLQSPAPQALFFSTALTLSGLLYLVADGARYGRMLVTAGCLALSLVGLSYQAGQPMTRSLEAVTAGRTKTVVVPTGLPRASLTVAAEEAALYGLLVNFIRQHSAEDDGILALPASPELYFLGERRNPLPFANLGIGLRNDADLRAAEAALAQDPPRLVFYRPDDRLNTPMVRRLMVALRRDYRLLETAGGFEIYLLRQ